MAEIYKTSKNMTKTIGVDSSTHHIQKYDKLATAMNKSIQKDNWHDI